MNTILLITGIIIMTIGFLIAYRIYRDTKLVRKYFDEQENNEMKEEANDLTMLIRAYIDSAQLNQEQEKMDNFGMELLEDAARKILEQEDRIRKANEERNLAQRLLTDSYNTRSQTQADWLP